ncbi:hypothetical protein SUGI_0319860 [Cryptomeria japonica]|uniref:short-chain type dehydrogenase/reductase-like n=1 Tax=Cryptomeria japonica TaxID=3369 RepID=UPI002408EB4F|nr:short-chain type dehydrogenase/reductase-like [Cryptomeria japonica]GLJ18113.1 hypothetical protein SUGI_0319860 [Cryptomeria japonica]
MADQSSLKDRVAIVTGASRGIGREIALHLARKGAKVVINYAGNAEKAEEVALTINKGCDTVTAVTCKADISKAIEVRKLFDVAEETFGPVHILVNNAGINDPKSSPLAETPEELWESIFSVNCKGAFLCSREAANRVVKGGRGRIINLSSSVVGSLRPGNAAYGASKAAVETMTKILARELWGTKVTANCVAPGPVATEMLFAGRSENEIQRAAQAAPFGRLGEVDDVAPVVAFLASDEGEWVNAQVVRVNGGYV